jgi:hypothetical protein
MSGEVRHAGVGADVVDQDDPRDGQAGKVAADAAARPARRYNATWILAERR